MSAATRSARSALSAACSGLLRISLYAFSSRTTSLEMTARRLSASSKLRILFFLLFCTCLAQSADELVELLATGCVFDGFEHGAQLNAGGFEHPFRWFRRTQPHGKILRERPIAIHDAQDERCVEVPVVHKRAGAELLVREHTQPRYQVGNVGKAPGAAF